MLVPSNLVEKLHREWTTRLPLKISEKVEQNAISSGGVIIGTHDGIFHCDEVMSIAILMLLPEYKDAHVIRTRNLEDLSKADIVVDVGGVYDKNKKRFDHHQLGFAEYFDEEWRKTTIMSSAGLVYKHYGKRVLQECFELESEKQVTAIYRKAYEMIIECIDALDNGVSITPEGVVPRYQIATDLTSRIARLNKCAADWLIDRDMISGKDFTAAIEVAQLDFMGIVHYLITQWWPGCLALSTSFDQRFAQSPSGRVLVMSDHNIPMDQIHELEKTLGIFPIEERYGSNEHCILFIVYFSGNVNKDWKVRCVHKRPNTFELRYPIPEKYLDKSLHERLNITFVHRNRFLAGVKSKEDALRFVEVMLVELGDGSRPSFS